MGEVLRGSPDVEPSLGAAMDSLRDPLASPHPPTNDRQVVEVGQMLGGGCLRIMGYIQHSWHWAQQSPQGWEWWWSWRWSWCQTSHITAEGTKTTTTTVITITIHLTTDSRDSHHRHHHIPFSNPPTSRVTRSVHQSNKSSLNDIGIEQLQLTYRVNQPADTQRAAGIQ